MLEFSLLIGAFFSPLAALTAFLITYLGYTRGQNPDKKLAMKMALQIAFFTLLVFFAGIISLGFILNNIIKV